MNTVFLIYLWKRTENRIYFVIKKSIFKFFIELAPLKGLKADINL